MRYYIRNAWTDGMGWYVQSIEEGRMTTVPESRNAVSFASAKAAYKALVAYCDWNHCMRHYKVVAEA